MKRILFITTQYRVGERIYPIIPELSRKYSLDLLRIYQMNSGIAWPGNIDMRTNFNKTYASYFDAIFDGACDLVGYDLIIMDDNRDVTRTNLKSIYKTASCPVVAFEHGNSNSSKERLITGQNIIFDKCFVFGKKDVLGDYCIPGGIPANDALIQYKNNKRREHILVIVNFLGNRRCPFKVQFNQDLFDSMELLKLQEHYRLPVVIKLKSRADENYKRNIAYLRKVLPKELHYQIAIDVVDDNRLIGESACVISAPSTLAFKSIQLNIPTALIKGSGALGSFHEFSGLVDISEYDYTYLLNDVNYDDWIVDSIEGAIDFNSSEIVHDNIDKLICY